MIPNTLPKGLTDNPLLAQWIGFEVDGRVRVSTGKVEIGQGILTALAQIAAEELDVTPDRIRLVAGETDGSPQEGTTAGSTSVSGGGAALRLACAEVRALFLEAAADALGASPQELAVDDGRILRDGAETGHDYWTLAGAVDLRREATGSAPVKRPAEFRIVGTSLPRRDLAEKVAGAAFIHDIAPDGLVHARILRRPRRGARLVGLDEEAIRRRAGTAVGILREGDLVAFTSEDETAVRRALEAAWEHAIWDGGTGIPDDAGAPDFLRALPSRDRVVEEGAPPAAADGTVLEASYSRPYIAHASIGPSTALAEFRDGTLRVWSHSQNVFGLRTWLARALGLSADQVIVHHRQGAGCYGHNPADDVAFDAAFVATRMPGRPVRAQWPRQDELGSEAYGTAGTVRIRAVRDLNGSPADWTFEVWSPVHAQRPGSNGVSNFLGAEALPNPEPPPNQLNDTPDAMGGGASRNWLALYDLPHQKLVHHLLDPNPVRTSSLRGLGAFLNVFAIESFVDELAAEAGADPVAYRLAMLKDPRARRVVETAAAMAGWQPGEPGGEGTGRGIAFSRYKNTAGYMALVAEVEVGEAVAFRRAWAAVDAGLVVNVDGASNQVEGGIVQAASWALKEEVRFADGMPATREWDDYPILRFSEVPEIDVRFVGEPHQPPLGLGEVAAGPTAAALANAVAHALGARIRDLPMTRERIMAALLA